MDNLKRVEAKAGPCEALKIIFWKLVGDLL